jgi:hypothetical protein
MTDRSTPTTRHPFASRKDTHMQQFKVQLLLVQERQALLRSEAAEHRRGAPGRPIRAQLGESIIRLGRRVAGESVTTPAWTG